ncbi:hypothetical protein [Streptomyces virginiae]
MRRAGGRLRPPARARPDRRPPGPEFDAAVLETKHQDFVEAAGATA